jgi:hypothetical protein
MFDEDDFTMSQLEIISQLDKDAMDEFTLVPDTPEGDNLEGAVGGQEVIPETQEDPLDMDMDVFMQHPSLGQVTATQADRLRPGTSHEGLQRRRNNPWTFLEDDFLGQITKAHPARHYRDLFWGRHGYADRHKIAAFLTTNGIPTFAFEDFLEMRLKGDPRLLKVQKKYRALFEDFKKPEYQRRYYAYNLAAQKLLYLDGIIRRSDDALKGRRDHQGRPLNE